MWLTASAVGLQVSRLVNVTTYVIADHLRGTPFLTWWFRALVSLHTLGHLQVIMPAMEHRLGLWWLPCRAYAECGSPATQADAVMGALRRERALGRGATSTPWTCVTLSW